MLYVAFVYEVRFDGYFETNSLERLIASIADFINAAGYCCNFMAQYCAFSGCEDKSCLASSNSI